MRWVYSVTFAHSHSRELVVKLGVGIDTSGAKALDYPNPLAPRSPRPATQNRSFSANRNSAKCEGAMKMERLRQGLNTLPKNSAFSASP
jgi:hypothetical protein